MGKIHTSAYWLSLAKDQGHGMWRGIEKLSTNSDIAFISLKVLKKI